ncbi:NAD-dependent epimerase/dehydratase family protein [Mucilaginibacter limnophilus]|uniref:NAD-dependent epimerase/dehydratase family protein n=1 Tax=Mucilaginibacter limnophilus TaxID=1932778 RepID=A0A3S2V7X0_9SPHI|nr:NAD-dependent epimerase/dehydratase family protein [Mucilaginibacter limnophilus]RVU00713.1 NAD-dependent epimerase/dehydratase family protein [Mucilaginibacter limnophilus]
MKNVIITGYSGFVGKNLTGYLMRKGCKITGVGRTQGVVEPFDTITYSQLSQLNNFDAIIHLAGKAHDLKNTSLEAEYFLVNTDLTMQVFKEFLRSEATDFIYLSTVKAAADSVSGELLETDEPQPATAYGRSKLAAEQQLLAMPLPLGKRLFIIRPCMIHGPGNKGNLNLLYTLVNKRVPYPLAAFSNKRSVLSIQNLLFALNAILSDSKIPGGIYNIADDEPLSTTQMIDIMAKALHIKAFKWHISPGLIKFAARAGDKLHLPLNSHRLQKLTESYVVNNAKLKKALGISKFPVSARDGLIYTALNL